VTLAYGHSPFGSQRGNYNIGTLPDDIAYVESWPRRMRAMFGNRTVLDSRRGMMLYHTDTAPTLLFPLDDFAADVLIDDQPAGSWTVRVGDRSAPGAVTTPPALDGPAGADIEGLVILAYSSMDRWFEEDDPVYAHLRDPYHRVDVRSSSHHVLVQHAGVVVAESARPKLLFETGLPVRYYLPFADVRIDLLELSGTITECPYKGDGQHWNLVGAGEIVEDAAWSLPHPLAEGTLALEHVSFYTDKVEVIVDGVRVP
jgi:uncharacterized protein (DUF427 family)